MNKRNTILLFLALLIPTAYGVEVGGLNISNSTVTTTSTNGIVLSSPAYSSNTATTGTEIVNYQTMTNKIQSYGYLTSSSNLNAGSLTGNVPTNTLTNAMSSLVWTNVPNKALTPWTEPINTAGYKLENTTNSTVLLEETNAPGVKTLSVGQGYDNVGFGTYNPGSGDYAYGKFCSNYLYLYSGMVIAFNSTGVKVQNDGSGNLQFFDNANVSGKTLSQLGGGDASAWSSYPATQTVDMASEGFSFRSGNLLLRSGQDYSNNWGLFVGDTNYTATLIPHIRADGTGAQIGDTIIFDGISYHAAEPTGGNNYTNFYFENSSGKMYFGPDTNYPWVKGTGTTNIQFGADINILPSESNTLNIGSVDLPFNEIHATTGYFSTNSIYLGTNKISATESGLKFNEGSINGGSINWVAVPATSSSPGSPGDMAKNNNYFYICIQTNTWRRTTLMTW